jgi:hypothetical protein
MQVFGSDSSRARPVAEIEDQQTRAPVRRRQKHKLAAKQKRILAGGRWEHHGTQDDTLSGDGPNLQTRKLARPNLTATEKLETTKSRKRRQALSTKRQPKLTGALGLMSRRTKTDTGARPRTVGGALCERDVESRQKEKTTRRPASAPKQRWGTVSAEPRR